LRSIKKSITIDNATEANSGFYRVLAKNQAGQDEAIWNVLVESIWKQSLIFFF
jgi:hypothetical protein